MIIIFVEFINQLIDYPINCASLNLYYPPGETLDFRLVIGPKVHFLQILAGSSAWQELSFYSQRLI